MGCPRSTALPTTDTRQQHVTPVCDNRPPLRSAIEDLINTHTKHIKRSHVCYVTNVGWMNSSMLDSISGWGADTGASSRAIGTRRTHMA